MICYVKILIVTMIIWKPELNAGTPVRYAAIANAIADACGVRLTELPLNAEAVFRALRANADKPLDEE